MIPLDSPRDSAESALARLLAVPAAADLLGRRFGEYGHELHLVGGSVRDALLGRPDDDLDFATDAAPEQILDCVGPVADAVWTTGVAFGTVGISWHGRRVEITTYRSESYDRTSRNPQVTYGETLEEDLGRRDFTINAMAVSVPGHVFCDPYGGLAIWGAGYCAHRAGPSAPSTRTRCGFCAPPASSPSWRCGPTRAWSRPCAAGPTDSRS